MLTIDVPLDEAREALTLARAQLAVRVAQLSNCRVCGADLQKFERALGTVRDILTQLEPAHGIHPREE